MSKWTSFGPLCGIAVNLLVFGCGGAKPAPKTENSASELLKTAPDGADDASRCEYKNRSDRDAKESAGVGSIRPNIRRVYAIVGDGDERRRTLLCREVDTNLDGVKDVVRTFNDKGESLREIADSDYDGKIDTWVTFAAGHMAKVELDTNRDGNPDEWRYYIKGKMARVQRDTNRDGKPDVWEIYEDGELRRIGVDLDHDGHVDRWDRDEIAERAALERELQEEEQRKKKEQEAAAAEQEPGAGTSGSGKDSSPNAGGGKGGATGTGKGGAAGPAQGTGPAKEYVSPRKR